MIRLALYQPEIPQNVGTLLRLGACWEMGIDIIEPCGFIFSDRRLKRAGMDYIDRASYQRHINFETFLNARKEARLIYLNPEALLPYTHFYFSPTDILIVGRESDGIPPEAANRISHQICIPMGAPSRSINMAIAAAIVAGEALRQTRQFPL